MERTAIMKASYDKQAWEQETGLGRRLYIHNFGLRGNEFAGWELIKTVVNAIETGVTEKFYLWRPKGGKEDEMVQVAVIESHYWRHAQQHLLNQLEHCMRPDLPRGKGSLAKIGDVQYAAEIQEARTVGAVFFTRGNLQIAVRSVGTKTVDVQKFAKRLDDRLAKAPTKAEKAKGLVTSAEPVSVKVKKKLAVVLIDRLPEATPRSGLTRVIVPEGEARREGDTLYFFSEQTGDKRVEVLNFKLE
jgi:hypothetical protein